MTTRFEAVRATRRPAAAPGRRRRPRLAGRRPQHQTPPASRQADDEPRAAASAAVRDPLARPGLTRERVDGGARLAAGVVASSWHAARRHLCGSRHVGETVIVPHAPPMRQPGRRLLRNSGSVPAGVLDSPRRRPGDGFGRCISPTVCASLRRQCGGSRLRNRLCLDPPDTPGLSRSAVFSQEDDKVNYMDRPWRRSPVPAHAGAGAVVARSPAGDGRGAAPSAATASPSIAAAAQKAVAAQAMASKPSQSPARSPARGTKTDLGSASFFKSPAGIITLVVARRRAWASPSTRPATTASSRRRK